MKLKPQLRELGTIFIASFVFNFIWEQLHSLLYTSYQGEPITEFVLFHATLGDAVILTLLAVPFAYLSWLRARSWLVVLPALALSMWIEWYALGVSRWVYGPHMPLVPGVNLGLTPVIQLALIGVLVYFAVFQKKKAM